MTQGDCLDVNECLLNNGHGPCQDTCTNRFLFFFKMIIESFLTAKAATNALVIIFLEIAIQLHITLIHYIDPKLSLDHSQDSQLEKVKLPKMEEAFLHFTTIGT